MPSALDLKDKKFGKLTAIAPAGSRGGRVLWRFKCDCGNDYTAVTFPVTAGKVVSCGCNKREKTLTRSTKHGYAKRGIYDPTYESWSHTRDRCRNPKNQDWASYGGQGVTFSPLWDDFEVFLADARPSPGAGYSIERVNTWGNYEPGNVVWLKKTRQSRNRRDSVRVFYRGELRVLADIAEAENVPYDKLYVLVRRSRWEIGKAISHLKVPKR